MISTFIGGFIAVILAILTYKSDGNFYIGQKIYYYVTNQEKRCAGRITATVLCYREEDITPNESRRIIPNNMREVVSSKWLLLEVQPIIGGRKIVIPATNVLEKVGD